MDQLTDLVFALLFLPLDLLDRARSDPRFLAAALAVSVVIALGLVRYQRCPHCRRLVRRAGRRWRTCPRCGRQYHGGLKRVS